MSRNNPVDTSPVSNQSITLAITVETRRSNWCGLRSQALEVTAPITSLTALDLSPAIHRTINQVLHDTVTDLENELRDQNGTD